MSKYILSGFLFFWAIATNAAPFLSSNIYPDTAPRPTEFLISINDGDEATSAAAMVKQASTVTLTAYDAATTYKITIGGQDVTQVGTGGTTTTTATAFATALNASANSNFMPITWASAGAVITGTADVGGTPFTPTSSVTGGTGTIGAPVETADPDGRFLLFDLAALLFGTYDYSVKAQNLTSTSGAATGSFEIGIETPQVHVIPVAP
mgnify:CR=1 FL=1